MPFRPRGLARRLLLVAGALALAPLVVPAPAHAGQVGATIGIRGAGIVEVVEGTVSDGARGCERSDNLDERVIAWCPRIRSEAPLEAWLWLRPRTITPDFVFRSWSGCDRTRERDGVTECAVKSGAFDSVERQPVAFFDDVVAPTVERLQAQQLVGAQGRFRTTFVASADAATYCRFGTRPYEPCTSGEVHTLPEGVHHYSVYPVDPSGAVGGMVQVPMTSVDTTITQAPPALTNQRAHRLAWSTSAGTSAECRIDASGWEPCGSGGTGGYDVRDLADGEHTVEVRGIDAAGNQSFSATYRWDIDDAAPETTLTGGPREGSFVLDPTARFAVGTDDPTAGVSCTLDGRARDCAGGALALTGLGAGTHVVTARATDPAGNGDATPATRSWTVPEAATSFGRRGPWKVARTATAYRGVALTTTRQGASLTRAVRGARGLALVVGGGRGHGTVKVYAGSRLLRKVSLATPRTTARRLVPLTTSATPWSGTLRVVVATQGRPVRVEGLGVRTR